MPLVRLTVRDGKQHIHELTELDKAELKDLPLPWRVTLKEGSSDRYNAVLAAQRKFFEENGGDTRKTQVRKFWEWYKPRSTD